MNQIASLRRSLAFVATAFVATAVALTTGVETAHAQAEPAACLSPDPAQWPAPSRPYFMILLDTSGSMNGPIATAPTCAGFPSTRMGHAKCAIRNLISTYSGQVNFGLAQFASYLTACDASCAACGVNCFNAEVTSTGVCAGCGPGTGTARRGANILVPMQQNITWTGTPTATNVPTLLSYLDYNCTGNIDIIEGGNTPINGSLRDMFRYFSTQWVNPDNAGIVYTTPLNAMDRPCRSVNVLLITDGDETCDTQTDAVNAAAQLLTGVTIGANRFQIRTHVINFMGGSVANTDAIAAAGGTTSSLFATNETQLSIGLSQIVANAARPEVCDNSDNNCNGCTDEGFVHYCNVQPVATNCCAWTTAAQRTTCLNNFRASITAANPSGNQSLLPCTTATQQTQPANWLCYDPGDRCDTVDNNCRSGVDEGARRCGAPLHCPVMETCNGQDDDCDGLIDNGGVCGTCVVAPEICDGCDNDCDGVADNGIAPIPCGLTSPANCAGTQTCAARAVPRGTCVAGGGWSACSNAPAPEVCDMVDNDCNGIVDDGLPSTPCDAAPGLMYGGTSQCRRGTMSCGGTCMGAIGPSPEVCDGLDNDCDGMTDEGIAGIGDPCCAFGTMCGTGICTSGHLACTGGISACVGGTGPTTETCNGTDDDCNGMVDDGVPAGGSCGSAVGACRTGTYRCTGGAYVCEGATSGTPEVCNNIDDDCNGIVDDGNPGGGAACNMDADAGPVCSQGMLRCRAGSLVCEGGRVGATEVCNCMDDDCDGMIDENTDGSLCPGGGACLMCECRTPCRNTEFPCSIGFRCDLSAGGNGFCVPDLCGGVMCRADQVCRNDMCVDPCDGVMCPSGQSCRNGTCLRNDCYTFGCPAGQVCRNSACIMDPCTGITCGANEFCRGGTCVDSCGSMSCPAGQSCRDGACAADPCGGVTCATGQICAGAAGMDGGMGCVTDPCTNVGCGNGRVCMAGRCVDDPCAGVTCPNAGEVCDRSSGTAQCAVPAGARPMRDRGIAAGGGGAGCSVATPGANNSSAGLIAAVLALVTMLTLRKRRGRIGSRTSVAASMIALGALGGGCRNEPFCFNCIADGAVTGDAGGGADARDVPPIPIDGTNCVPQTEICDGLDNDCNGLVDEGFDLQSDERNCGGCGVTCQPPHAAGLCNAGRCEIAPNGCDVGWHDLDGQVANGCEYACTATGTEVCDGRDNDCNGQVDEGFDLMMDVANCGSCGTVCRFDNAAPSCVAGICRMAMCNPGFLDLDTLPSNGCEYACTPSGAEVCDGRDNDCNGQIDEGFDLQSDMANCGACGRACVLPGATSTCVTGMCRIGMCMPGARDIDGNPDNGCEWSCGAPDGTTSPEVCDAHDNNCDGTVDEGFDLLNDVMNCGTCGTRCGAGTSNSNYYCDAGICRFRGCTAGHYDLDGDGNCEYACTFRSSTEACNNLDDNCDGRIDENVMAPSPSAVCGTRPGATRAECTSGVTVACVAGAWRCTFPTGVCNPTCAAATEVCDALDNNCDGRLNENVPNYGQPCASDDGMPAPGDGVCRTTGTYVCNGTTATRCNAVRASCASLPGGCAELCDGLDNDCDGLVDETFNNKGSNATYFVQPSVVHTATNVWMYAYEASRPGATATMPGIGNGFFCSAVNAADPRCSDATIPVAPAGTTLDRTPSCSESGNLPWFNVRPNEAQQTCRAVGGHLCTTAELTAGCQSNASCSWAYAPRGAACTSALTATKFCNLGPFDFNSTAAGDQDGLLPTGSSLLRNCYADWSGLLANTAGNDHVYDVTGNLREITFSGTMNQYRLIGGSFLSPVESGVTCSTTFYTVDQTFQYFDTGFRCCFSANPTL